MNADFSNRRVVLADALDRHGADFAGWPDRALASEARAAVLADRQLRAYRDDAAALARGLAGVRTGLDAEIAAGGGADRVRAALLARVKPQPKRLRWMAVAAALIVAAGLGGAFDLTVLAPQDQARYDVVTLDPLGFGVTEGQQQ